MFTLTPHTATSLQEKIDTLNNWLENHYPAHYLYQQKKQARDYYVNKYIELQEHKVSYINA